MSINCRVSFKNNELEVVDKNGQPSKLYYDALELTGNEDKAFDLWYKAFSQEFTEQVKANRDDVTLDEVLKFVSVNSSFRKSLDISEVREIKDIMDKNSFETLSSFNNTLKEIFRPEGITELNTRKAYESGLYDLEGLSEVNLDEIDDLLDKIEGTLIKTDIYVTSSSDTSANFIDTSRRTILGTPEFISQEEIEEEIISKIENTKDSSQISSLINNLPYGSFAERFNSEESFRNQILKNVGAYTKVNTLFIENGIPTTKNLTHFSNLKRTLGTNNKTVGLAADIEFLREMSDTVWAENQEEVKDVLRDIAFYQFNDNNIDIFGLDKNSSNKKVVLDTLNSLGEMLKNPTNESILDFSDKFSALVPQPTSLASEILPENLEPFAQNIFKVHSNLSETELFRDHGLIKVASNLYHKVDLGDRSNLYEQLYQKAKEEGSPIYLKSEDKQEGLRELEKYVMLQDSPLEKDVKEEHILNKLIFNHPKTQDTNDYSQLSDITTDPEYLVGGFPTDFSDYIVTEKQKDSQLYRSTLSKFRVGESGVYLISPVNSIEGIDFQKELEDYIRLSKDQSMKYLLPAKTSSLSKGVDLRAINDPLSVPTYSRQYSVDNGLLVTETTSSDNIRFYGKTYSKVAEDTKNSVFKQVPVNPNNNFYSINNNFITEEDKSIASQVLNDAKFSFVDSVVTKQDFDNSVEKAGIQNKVRFSIFGETAARNLDKLEGTNRRTDNLEKAIGMDQELRDKDEYKGSDGKVSETMIARAIKIATEWEKGIDGIWRFESNDERAKLNFGIKTKNDITKVRTLGEVLNYPELFDAYPTIKDVKVFFDTEAGNFEDAYSLYTDTYKEIGLGYKEDTLLKSIEDLKVLNKYSAETISALINKVKMFDYADRLDRLVSEGKISIDDVNPMLDERFSPDKVEEWNKQLLKDDLVEEELNLPGTPYEYIHYKSNKNYYNVLKIINSQKSESYISTENLNEKLKSTLLHEIQHIIQKEEGFADGGNAKIALYVMDKDQYKKYEELVEKSKEVSIYVLGQNREVTQEEYAIITAPSSMAHAVYKRLAGEVEARNVEDRLIIPWSMRKKLLLQKTEELARVDQIVYKAKDIVLNLKKNLDTKTTTDQVIDKLKESKLATNVRLMTSKEISKQLEDIGIDSNTKKQLNSIPETNREELAQDYFVREADRLPLTLSVFNRPEFIKMQGKVVNKISILNSLNQSGIKQIEKDLIKSVIEDYYKDQAKVSYDEVEATVRANIMPLEVLNTDSYSDYGMSNLDGGDYGNHNTIILNSPLEHGVVGHFSSSFISENREDLKYVPKQLNNNTWVAVQEGYEDQANGNNIYQFVGTAGTKEVVDEWISKYKNPSNLLSIDDKSLIIEVSEVSQSTKEQFPDSDIVDVQLLRNGEVLKTSRKMLRDSEENMRAKIIDNYNIEKGSLSETAVNKGMFGHIRVWNDGEIYNVAELQSDYFQNKNAKVDLIRSKKEKAEDLSFEEVRAEKKEVINSIKRDLLEFGVKTDDTTFFASSGKIYDSNYGDTVEIKKLIDLQQNVRNNKDYQEIEDKIEETKLRNYKLLTDLKKATDDFNSLSVFDLKQNDKSFVLKISEKLEKLVTPQEKQFIASQKEWEKRIVREALKLASSSGAKKLRFPTPHTLSVIEGYISGDGAPYGILSADDYDNLVPGDRIDYLGSELTVISSNRNEIETVLTEDVRKQDIEEYIDSEVEYFTNEVINSELGLDFESQYTEEEFNDANKHSSIEGLDLEDISEKVDDDLYEISRDKVEQAVRDYFSIIYNEDNIESILSDQGYENINVDGRFVYYTDRGIYTETLSQPDEYSNADKDTFSISDLTDTQQTVAKKYVELAEILRKEVGEDNVETVTDDQGFDWYETDVEDKYSNKAVVAFKKGLSEKGVKPIVNGFVYNNEVFLNKDTVTEETPIHEFNHLFTDWLKKNRPSVYKKGISLVNEELTKEDSDIASVINYVKQTQPDLQGEKLLEEILTELTGREGAALIESGRKSGIIEWLKNFFKEIGDMLGILDATPAQVANMTVGDFAKSSAVQLLKGEDIMSKMNSLRDSISNATAFSSEYTPINDTVYSVAEELRACN